MKKIIIVDPFSTGALLAPELKKKGNILYSVLSDNNISDFYKSSYKKEDFSNPTLMTIDEAKKKLNFIDSVIIGAESGVFAGDLLAEYFNVRGNSSHSSIIRRDKYLMQETLKRNGLNHIKSYEINPDNYISIISTLDNNKEYVLKPKSSAGSDGVLYFNNKIKLLEFINDDVWKKSDLFGNINSSYLVQEYISGREFVIDMIIDQNDIFIASLCIYEKCNLNNNKFIYKSLTPLDPNENIFDYIIDYAKKCAKALEIKHGPAHMEIFYTLENKPIMVEVGARLHGGIAPLLFKECYEDNLLDSTVNYFNKNNLPKSKKARLKKNGKIVFLMNKYENSILNNIDGFKYEISRLNSFFEMKIFCNESEILPLTVDLTNIPGIICLSHYNKKQIDHDEKMVYLLFDKYLTKK